MDEHPERDYIVVKALESGVSVIGMTRGRDTRLLHTEKLMAGEVLVAQFTDNIPAMKIHGRATVLTACGAVQAGPVTETEKQAPDSE